LLLKFFNIKIPKDQIFQRKKNTPIRPASLHDLTDTHSSTKPKRTNFCKSQSFYLTTLLWIFMLLGEARKEGSDKELEKKATPITAAKTTKALYVCQNPSPQNRQTEKTTALSTDPSSDLWE
jgi:hypothetical protein